MYLFEMTDDQLVANIDNLKRDFAAAMEEISKRILAGNS